MALTLNQHRFGVTQEIIHVFSDTRLPKSGLSSFFKPVFTQAEEVSIEVQRDNQYAAVDVVRCTGSNNNEWSLSAEKLFKPPFFSEGFYFTACQAYDVTFGMGVAPNAVQKQMILDSAQKKIMSCKAKIMRAINIQIASVLQTGTVLIKNGDSIDYKRKAASLPVNTGASAWSQTTTSNPVADLSTDAQFLRDTGLSTATVLNVIMGSQAFSYFMLSSKVLSVAAIFNQIRRVDLQMPQIDGTTGLAFQGQIGGTDFIFNIWTYNDSYKNSANQSVQYLNTANYIMIPDDFEGDMVYAGVPFIFGDQFSGGQFVGNTTGDFVIHDVIDQVKRTQKFEIESAPLPIPVSIDRIVTRQTF